jgi:hypothetical protein
LAGDGAQASHAALDVCSPGTFVAPDAHSDHAAGELYPVDGFPVEEWDRVYRFR